MVLLLPTRFCEFPAMNFGTITVSWQITPVDVEVGYSTWPSLAFSPTGQPAIAYYSSVNHALRFATLNTGGTWDISTVDSDVFGELRPMPEVPLQPAQHQLFRPCSSAEPQVCAPGHACRVGHSKPAGRLGSELACV
jgi:hypothetical protein